MLSTAYKRYALGVMTIVVALNFFDRGVMVLLLEPIKRDLQLSDTQLGFVTGIAFAMFYATVGLPIARWADRGNRVTIASLAIGIWGLAAMACGLVTSFVQLLCVRIFAAIGEAGGQPPTYSLVGDYFPAPSERIVAMYLYQSFGPLSGLLSFMLAGWLNEQFGWRMTFMLVGVPGLVLAILVKWTLREPRAMAQSAGVQAPAPAMKAVLATLWNTPSCRHLTLAMILIFLVSTGVGPWYAAFMMRSHGMETAELGVWLGMSSGLGGIGGILLGAFVIGRWFAADYSRQMRMAAVGVGAGAPLLVAFLTVPDRQLALLMLLPQAALIMAFLPAPFATLQRLVPPDMRATAYTLILLFANLIGMGLGPQIVGILSDLLTPRFGVDGLRYAMLVVSLAMIWAGIHLWIAASAIKLDEAETRDLAVSYAN